MTWDDFLDKYIFSPSFIYNKEEYYPVYYALIAFNIFLIIGVSIACYRYRSRNDEDEKYESTNKTKLEPKKKGSSPGDEKHSYTPVCSAVDIESETDSGSSEASILTEHTGSSTRKSPIKDSLVIKSKPHPRNNFLFDKNPLCYELYTVNTDLVAKQTASTQTESKPIVAKKTVSTQASGKRNNSTQTFIDKKYSSRQLNYSLCNVSNESLVSSLPVDHGYGKHSRCLKPPEAGFYADHGEDNRVNHNRYHKSPEESFYENHREYYEKNRVFGREMRPKPSFIDVEQNSANGAGFEPLKNTIFREPLTYVETP